MFYQTRCDLPFFFSVNVMGGNSHGLASFFAFLFECSDSNFYMVFLNGFVLSQTQFLYIVFNEVKFHCLVEVGL